MGRGARTEREGMVACLVKDSRALSPRAAMDEVLHGFKENDLLTYASAISFQVVFALVPLALLSLGLLGMFGLSDWWSSDAARTVKDNVSPTVYAAINDTVQQILAHRQVFWATLGAAIAVWEVSGAMRATMQVLNRVYLVEETRTFRQKLLQSITLSTIVTVLLLLAALAVKLGPIAAHGVFGDGVLVSVLSFLAAWGLAIAILFVVVTLVVRYAPDTRRPVRWVSFGGLVVIVTMSYIYLSAIVFLTGLQLDSLIRNKVDIRHEPDEQEPGPTLYVAQSLSSVQATKLVERP